jgi:small basic protein
MANIPNNAIEDTWELGDTTFPSPMALFGMLAILAGLFSVVTGILGLLAAKFKKCCFTLPFMIFAVIMCIIMLIVTLLALIGQGE